MGVGAAVSWQQTVGPQCIQGCDTSGVAIPQASSYRDQREDRIDHTSSYGGVGWLAHPSRLEDAG